MTKKLTQEEFQHRSKKEHGESKYDYSRCVYTRMNDKVWLRCIEHDHWFNVRPADHLSQGIGCTKCSGKYKRTTEDFICDSKAVHGEGKYDYSRCVFKKTNDKVILRCIEHNHIFEVTPDSHLHQGTGCTKCSARYRRDAIDFISEATKVHGCDHYDYSRVEFIDMQHPVVVRCIHHDYIFVVNAQKHISRNQGCPKCANVYRPTKEEFIANSKELHGATKYDYSMCEYINNRTKVTLRCIEHNHTFEVSPNLHISQKIGCTKCSNKYKRTAADFINDSKEIHGESKYDYSRCVFKKMEEKVWLRCTIHDHWFDVMPRDHLSLGVGCTKCAGNYRRTNDEFINESKEIHGESKYDYSKCVFSVMRDNISLRCIEHDYWFEVKALNHIHQKIGCPKCNSQGFSKMQCEYFTYLMQLHNIHISHAGNDGEMRISGIGKMDGYCKETNTYYEFHGVYWHGHPSKFNPVDTHPLTKKTYGELYEKTLERDQKIRDMGYNLVVMWEHEWQQIKKENS